MTRGNAHHDIVHDDDDRIRVLADLERTGHRFGGNVLALAIMSNHLHLWLKTPWPNPAKGMQAFLSALALWSARWRRRPGYLVQGRSRAEWICVHLNNLSLTTCILRLKIRHGSRPT